MAFVQPLSQAGTCCSNTKRHSRKSAADRRRRPVEHQKNLFVQLDALNSEHDETLFARAERTQLPARRGSDPFAALRGHSLRHRQGCGLGVSRGPFRPRACVAAAPDPAPAGRRHAATRSFSWQRTGKMSDRATPSCSLTQGISFIIIRNDPRFPGKARRKKGARPFAAKVVTMHRPAGADRFSLVGGGCGVSQVSGSRARGSSVRRRYVFRRTFLL